MAIRRVPKELFEVKKLYVDSLGDNPNAIQMRTHILHRLQRSHKIEVVPPSKDADAVLKGRGELWTIGHVSVTRSHSTSSPVLQGFLSAEVIGKNNQTLVLSSHTEQVPLEWYPG